MTFFIQIGLAVAAVAALGFLALSRMGKALQTADPKVSTEVAKGQTSRSEQ